MKSLMALTLFTTSLFAADGVIGYDNREHTVSATVGDVNCVFTGPVHDTIIISCWINTDQLVRLVDADTLEIGKVRTGAFDSGQEDSEKRESLITWRIVHDGLDHYTFEIHAANKVLNGNF